jgi:CBS domain containing-hemolysin-like protein
MPHAPAAARQARTGVNMRKQIPRRTAAPRLRSPWKAAATLLAILGIAPAAHASLFHGETLDAIADGAAWVVLFIAPLAGIGIFLLIHILPEKIAEKKKHPQLNAIKTLCLLSLVFGGMLWPLAWLWAYTKPVIHKMAYGTDVDEHDSGGALHIVDDANDAKKEA